VTVDRPGDRQDERDQELTDAEAREAPAERGEPAGEADQMSAPEDDRPAATATAERDRVEERDVAAEQRAEERDATAEQATGSLLPPPPSGATQDREDAAAAAGTRAGGRPPTSDEVPYEMLSADELSGYRERWDALQAGFVDDPKAAAQQADALVGELLRRFTERHESLRGELGQPGEGADTEAMRLALRRYRVFFLALVRGDDAAAGSPSTGTRSPAGRVPGRPP